MAIYLVKKGFRLEDRYSHDDYEYDHLLREFALATEEEARRFVTNWYNKRATKNNYKSKMLGEPKDGQMGAWLRYEPEFEDEAVIEYCYYRKINLCKYNG